MSTIIDGDSQDKFDVSLGELEKLLGGGLATGQPDDAQKMAAVDAVDWDHLLLQANQGAAAAAPEPPANPPTIAELMADEPAPREPLPPPETASGHNSSAAEPETPSDEQLHDLLASLENGAPKTQAAPEPNLAAGTGTAELPAQLSPEPELLSPPAPVLPGEPPPQPDLSPDELLPPEPVVESVTTLPDPAVPSEDDLRSLLASLGGSDDEPAASVGTPAPLATPPAWDMTAAPGPDTPEEPPAWGAAEAQLPDELAAELPAPAHAAGGAEKSSVVLKQMDELLAAVPALPEAPAATARPAMPPAELAPDFNLLPGTDAPDNSLPPLPMPTAQDEPQSELPPDQEAWLKEALGPLAGLGGAAAATAAPEPPEPPEIPAAVEQSVAAWERHTDWQPPAPTAAAPSPADAQAPPPPPVLTLVPAKKVPAAAIPAPAPAPVNLPPDKQVLACMRAGMYRDAVTIIKSLIAAAPSHADHYYNLSVACHRLHDAAGARAALERCLELDGNSYRALCNLAGMLYEEGDLAGAQELLERAVGLNPFDSHSAYNLKLVRRKRSGKSREKKAIRR